MNPAARRDSMPPNVANIFADHNGSPLSPQQKGPTGRAALIVNEVVALNVGGKVFSTSLTTLRKHPGSVIAQMFTEPIAVHRDDMGHYFVDRNGDVFEFILDYLRDGYLYLPDDAVRVLQLKRELAFYGLPVANHLNTAVQTQNPLFRYDHCRIVCDGNNRVIETMEKNMPRDIHTKGLLDIVNFFGSRGFVLVSEYTQRGMNGYVSVWMSRQVPWS